MSRRDFGYFVIVLIVILIVVSVYLSFTLKDNELLKEENAELQQQLQALQQQKAGYKEGKYTMITNLSSSMYLNRIPANFEKINPWTDVNGVSGFDVTINGTHYRYVEGHIEMPQLALYVPYMTVMSDSVWPKEGK